jgi:hypothetical protein
MKHVALRALAVVAAIGVTLLLLHRTSQARGIPASAGRSSQSSCFILNGSTLTNVCGTIQRLDIPVTVDSTNNWHLGWASAFGATPSNNVGCQLISFDQNANAYWATPQYYLPLFGSSQILSLGSVWIPTNGAAFFGCDVFPGGRVNAVRWTP